MKLSIGKKICLLIVSLYCGAPVLVFASAGRVYSGAQRTARRAVPRAQQIMYRGMTTTTPRVQPRVPTQVPSRSIAVMPRILLTPALPYQQEEPSMAREWTEEERIFTRLNLKDAADAFHERDIDLAKEIVLEAERQKKFAKALLQESDKNPDNKNLAELAAIANKDKALAVMAENYLISSFEQRAKKGDKEAERMSLVLKETAEKEARETSQDPVATSWEEQYAQFEKLVESMQTRSQLSMQEEETRLLFNKLFLKDIVEAMQGDTYLSKGIKLDAQRRTEFAKRLTKEAEKHPGNETLEKLAEIARNNAFAAEFKLNTLHKRMNAKEAQEKEEKIQQEAQEKAVKEAQEKEVKEAQEKEEKRWINRIRRFLWGKK